MGERELIKRCKQEEKNAYRKLYETYAAHMKGICLRYTGDEMLAEDVLHDGFIKVFASIRSFDYRGEGSLKAWMSRIFCNESLSFIKRKSKAVTLSLDEVDIPDEETDISDWDTIPSSVLMEFITALNLNYRLVFNMYIFEDMSHKEIGKELGISEEASRVRLSRAKTFLVQMIKTYLAKNE